MGPENSPSTHKLFCMPEPLVADALALALEAGGHHRAALALTGPPAAGKSTLARYLVRRVNQEAGKDTAGYLPMDGFHLSNAQLDRLGRRDRKGAPDTFDGYGYVALLQRLLTETTHPVYVPDYDRVLHEPVAARHVFTPATSLVVTEGNYLAFDEEPWSLAQDLYAELWYVEAADSEREQRLHQRQVRGGATPEAAREWVVRSDRPNGELVKRFRDNCTRVVPGGLVPRH